MGREPALPFSNLMKNSILAACAALALCLTGCTGASFAKGITGMGADNATVVVKYAGVYGPITAIRCNPKPGQAVTINTDGSITTAWIGTTNSPAK